jgi:multidrug resistance efflux pump
MNGMKRIPVPWKHRWRRFRYTTLPMLGFFTFTGFALWLWTHAGELPHAIGAVESVQVNLASSVEGILKPLPRGNWKLYERVEADQVVAQLDDRVLRSQIITLQEELVQFRKEFEAESSKLAMGEADRFESHFVELSRLRDEREKRRLAVVTQQVQVAVDRLEAERTRIYLECIEPLYEKKMIAEQEIINARLYRDQAAKRLTEDLKVVAEAESQQKAAQERVDQMPAFLPAVVDKQLGALAAAIEVQQKRIAELETQIELLTIRSPLRGMICAIHHWPNESVPAGEPIVTIASDQGRYLVSFVRQEQHINLEEGMTVDVRKRAILTTAVESVVERVGPQIELVPQHLCRDPKIPEWGLPVRITLPDNFSGRPGELFEIMFKKNSHNSG